MAHQIQVIGIEGIPEVRPGDDLVGLILSAIRRQGLNLRDHDILAVTQKIVSKAEGRLVRLSEIKPSPFALSVADSTGKDPRLVEVILRETRRIVKMDRNLIVVQTRHGFVCANAGVDQSNVGGEDLVSLLPLDPDASARYLRDGLKALAGVDVAVIVCDTFGRPWREGLTEVALGVSGMRPLLDLRGVADRYGRTMRATILAVADELAAAAGLVFGKVANVPAAIIRGYSYKADEGSGRDLLRSPENDLFR